MNITVGTVFIMYNIIIFHICQWFLPSGYICNTDLFESSRQRSLCISHNYGEANLFIKHTHKSEFF